MAMTMNNLNPNLTPASLYVGDLKSDVTEAILFDVFNSIGPVASIRVCRDVITRSSLGYAYVNFHSASDAERALDTMNYTSIRGRACRIMWSQRDPSVRKSGKGNIFVKNLHASIDNKTLYDTFSMFGSILSCKVAMDEKNNPLGFGFVHYETEEAADKAIEQVDDMMIGGQKVSVVHFKPRSEREGPKTSSFTNVYVKELPKDVTEESLKAIFEPFGTITSVCLPLDSEKKLRGFGFINFQAPESAIRAIEELHEKPPLNLYVCRAQTKLERSKELRDRFEKIRIELADKCAGVNLYIKNLDDSVDDDMLKEAFAPYGEITSHKIMRDADGRSKNFGFVCYSKPEEAAKAVTTMNTRMFRSKPLYVALAQRREIRRQQLEAMQQQKAQANRPKQMQPVGMPSQMYPPGTPMFYPTQQPTGVPRPGPGFMYPQPGQMPHLRWNPRQMQQPGQMIPNMYMMQQLQGMPPSGGQPRNAMMRNRVMSKPNRQMNPAMQQNTRIRFENTQNQQAGSASNATQGDPSSRLKPLSAKELVKASQQEQKQMIGEHLFYEINATNPELAGKITGMLLEMDNDELLILLEDKKALNVKINEAKEVLNATKRSD